MKSPANAFALTDRRCLLVVSVLLQCLCQVGRAWAAAPTTTTVTASPSGTQGPQQIITLKATVSDSSGPVAHGSVSFYDGTRLLHTTQLVSLATGGYTPGSAAYRAKFTAGSHLLSAKFLGTNSELQSTSAQVVASISAVEPSATVLTKAGAPGTYQLAASVYGFGRTQPTGSIGFFDTTGNSLLGNGGLSPASPSSAFVQTAFASTDLRVTNPVVADIDGDGIPDVAYVISGNTLLVDLGKGDGTFAAPKSTSLGPASSTYQTFTFADMNGDGVLDCIVGSSFANVAVLLGNGDGTFGAPQTIPAGDSNAKGVTVGDFNGDGFPDIAVAQLSGTVTVLLGSGSGGYTSSTFSVPIQPVSIQAVDLNNDGKVDLVTFPLVPALGHGDGTFTVINSLPGLNDSFMNQLIVADVNGDGIPDFVLGQYEAGLANVGVLQVLLGKGDGSFITPGWTYQYPADRLLGFNVATIVSSLNPSILAMSFNPTSGVFTLETFVGNADGTFKAPIVTPHAASTPAFGDLNGDGLTDIVSVLSEGYLPTYGQFTTEVAASVSSTGSFTPGVSADRTATVVGQYAGDGAFAASVSQAVILQGTTSVSLSVTPASTTPGGAVMFTAKATDGTGANVIAGMVSFYDGQALLMSVPVRTTGAHAGMASYTTSTLASGTHSITARYLGTSVYSNSVSPAQTLTISGKYPTKISLSTAGTSGNYTLTSMVTGAGHGSPTGTITFTDLTTGSVLGTLSLPSTPAAPAYTVTATMATGTYPGPLTIADFNGDGLDDVAVANQDVTISVSLARGDGTLAAPQSYSVNSSTGGVVAGDFNGDGVLDLAVSGYNDQSIQVLLGKGDGTFQNATTGVKLSGTGYTALAAGDFDQDGRLDIAVVDAKSSLLRILKGNGDGTFALSNTYTDSGGLASVITGDLNGDGKLDLIYQDVQGGSIKVFLGKGDGTFASAGYAPFPNLVGSPALIDLNSDSHLDLLVHDNQSLTTVDVTLGAGDGSFGSAKASGSSTTCAQGCYGTGLTTLDFNRDGIPDVAFTDSSGLTLLKGNGDGTFTANSTVSFAQTPNGVAAANLATGPPALIVLNGYGIPSLSLVTAYPSVSAMLSSITAAGNDQIQATYSGDAAFQSSMSSVIVLNGKLSATPVLTLTIGSFANAVAGTAIPAKVTLSGSGTSTPTGSVQLYDGGSPIGSPVALSGGQASFTTSGLLTAGTRAVTARYSGDSSYNPATSAAVAVQIVAIGADSINLATSAATTQYGGVTVPIFGALNVSSLGANPTGTFVLFDGNTQIATSSLSGSAPIGFSFSINTATTPLSTGTHTLSVRYSGDGNWAASVSPNLVLTINAPDFTLSPGSGGLTSLSVTRGGSASTTLTIGTMGSFSGTIALSCSGNPSESTCSIAPSSLVNGGTATLTVATTAPHALLQRDPFSRNPGSGASPVALALIFFLTRRQKLRRFGLLAAFVSCLFGIAGCGGTTASSAPKTNPDAGTPAGQYSLTVTATSGTTSHTIPVQLTVN